MSIEDKYHWLDYYFSNYSWFRKYRGGKWYKHQFTSEALWICCTFTSTFWARYDTINRYSTTVKKESY